MSMPSPGASTIHDSCTEKEEPSRAVMPLTNLNSPAMTSTLIGSLAPATFAVSRIRLSGSANVVVVVGGIVVEVVGGIVVEVVVAPKGAPKNRYG